MSRLVDGVAWRLRRLARPAAPATRFLGAVPRRLRSAARRKAFERELATLRSSREAADAGSGRPLRVLAVGDWTFPRLSQSFVQQELAALVAAGFDVRVAASARGPAAALAPAAGALAGRIVDLPGDAAVGRAALARFRRERAAAVEALLDRLARESGRSREGVESDPHVLRGFAFARLAEAFGADWIQSYFFYEGSLAALVAAELVGLPRGLTAYADHRLDDAPWKLVRAQLATVDRLVATSRRVRDELVAIEPGCAERILVKPNGIDVSFWSSVRARERGPAAAFRLVSVARLAPKKGLDVLVAAVARLRDAGFEVELDLVGGAEDAAGRAIETALRADVAARGLDAVVRFRGPLAAEAVREALAGADLFVAPFVETAAGDKDGIPTALLEAMACGCAVVATRAGSIAEAVAAGVDGKLVEPGDAAALATAIRELLERPEERARFGAAAVERVRREFAIERTEPALAAAIREVVSARAAVAERRAR